MEAGRELDALVAEKVIGGRHKAAGWGKLVGAINAVPRYLIATSEELRHYSTDISAAWEVVAHLSPAIRLGLSEYRDGWRAIFSSTKGHVPLRPIGEAPTASHAICLAALKVVGYDED